MKTVISTDKAPAAIGPYSQAIQAGDFLYVSGQLPIDMGTGALFSGPIGLQANCSLTNLKAILEAAGYSLEDVVKTTIFLTNMDNFTVVNDVYAQFFGKNPPARSCVAVAALPKGAQLEIEAVAWKRQN